MSPELAAFGMWLIAITFYGGIGGYYMVPQLLYLHDLSQSNGVTQGEIVEIHPQMHSTCEYRFSIDGHSYNHTGRSCGDSRIGQQIAVYFSPRDPGISINGDPHTWFTNDLIPSVLTLVLFPLVAAAFAYWRVRSGGSLWSRWRD